jgi:ABC-type multidrug transport system fused ATPase/permease subunit
VWFFLVLAGVLLFTFGQTYLQAYVGQMIMKDLRTEAFDHTVGLSLRYLDSQPVGRLVNRITNDVETVNELFTSVLPSLLRDFVMMGGVLVALTLLSPRLALVTLATLPPVLVLTLLFRSRAREVFRRVRQAVSRLNGFLAEHLSGMRIVQLFVRERFSLGQFRERNDRLLEANLGEMYVFATFRPLVDLLSTTSLAVIVYFGGWFVLRDLVSLGTLIAFLNLIRMFYEPVMDLSEKYNILQSAMAGSERVFALLDTDARIPEPAVPRALDGVRGAIQFDRVSFAYKEGVLRELPSGRRGRPWPSWAIPAPARPPSPPCSPGCGTSNPGPYAWTGRTSANTPPPACAGACSPSCKTCSYSPGRSRKTSAWAAPFPISGSGRRWNWCGRTHSSTACPEGWKPGWPNAAPTSPWGSGSCCPSPACWPTIRTCSSWTRPPATSTPRPKSSSRRRW